MPKAMKTCSVPGCPDLVPQGSGRCTTHATQADRARGTSTQRGYGHHHRTRFREAVLARDPICTLCRRAPSHHADHYPLDRRELVARGMNPNHPRHGRGLCAPCHAKATATHQPGGWHTG
jgi:5-methylcytosine-specific restriction protein A